MKQVYYYVVKKKKTVFIQDHRGYVGVNITW